MTASWDRPIDSDASDRWNLGYCPHAAKRSGFSGRKAKSKTKEWALDQVVDTVQEKVQKAVQIVEVDGFSLRQKNLWASFGSGSLPST
jgi:hypothetical protein